VFEISGGCKCILLAVARVTVMTVRALMDIFMTTGAVLV
jgi:hypothetical protein